MVFQNPLKWVVLNCQNMWKIHTSCCGSSRFISEKISLPKSFIFLELIKKINIRENLWNNGYLHYYYFFFLNIHLLILNHLLTLFANFQDFYIRILFNLHKYNKVCLPCHLNYKLFLQAHRVILRLLMIVP